MPPHPGPIAEASDELRVSVAAQEEVESALITEWTLHHKLSAFNNARRWLSRGILCLILSGFAVLAALVLGGYDAEDCEAHCAQEKQDYSSQVP